MCSADEYGCDTVFGSVGSEYAASTDPVLVSWVSSGVCAAASLDAENLSAGC